MYLRIYCVQQLTHLVAATLSLARREENGTPTPLSCRHDVRLAVIDEECLGRV